MTLSSRAKLILVGISTFLIGSISFGFAGWYVAIYFTTHFFTDAWMFGNAVDAQRDIATLKALHNRQTQVVANILENNLNHRIVALRTDDEYADRTNKAVQDAIRIAGEYRNQYPWKSESPEIDQAVADVLDQK